MNSEKINIISIIAGIVTFLIVSSCNSDLEKEIKWSLDDYPDMLVVEALITNRPEKQFIYLTKTGPYLSNDVPVKISGAAVTVSDGTNSYSYSESETVSGEYISDSLFQGIPSNTYTLHISLRDPLNNMAEYTANSTMPNGLDLDTIVCEIYPMPDFGFETGEEEEPDTTLLGIYYYGKEPDDPENYYLAVISKNSVPWQRNAKDLIRFTDDQNNGGQSDFILFADNVNPGDTITFEVSSVERKYYDYIGSIQQMDQSGSAYSMSGPPANAVGNIPGALGFFRANYISIKKGIAIDRRK
ncbi:MAG TPA: DUF4249 domain-containing protein [Bacteroidales bacterium]|jgi:hypothetical protein|nr:DUF4249 domain-containing protein [Bacteroidales bacterium]